MDMTTHSLELFCIVMPPAHGKSYFHNCALHLLESDKIYDCRGDPILAGLRLSARADGNWSAYDIAWAERIRSRLSIGKYVLMVPSIGNCLALHGNLVARVQLDDSEWTKNLESRGKKVADYEYSRQKGDDVIRFNNRDKLGEWLSDIAATIVQK
jgi:hypothetical protein